ncbi:M23 family metallopeptidase [Microbacterium gorillae]|uniref:M23 family metallopeptidase n=1 Tax=Microbacterium gorillae TaxID=1231063 RepID=UPI003D97FB85
MNDEIAKSPPGITRRNVIALGMVAAGAAVVGGRVLDSDVAHAAVLWGHPFAYRATVTSPFGMRNNKMHEGVDYGATQGTPIYAVASGQVTDRGVLGTAGAYGNACFISHAEGWSSRYAHMVDPAVVSVGQQVQRGQLLGYVGETGVAYGAHLHLEIRTQGTPVDPVPLVQNAPLAGTAIDVTNATLLEDDDMSMLYAASVTGGTKLIFANAGLFWVVDQSASNEWVATGNNVVWLSDFVLTNLVNDARASKSKVSAPVLLKFPSASKVVYCAHGGAVLLSQPTGEEYKNLRAAGVPAIRVSDAGGNTIINNLRAGVNS